MAIKPWSLGTLLRLRCPVCGEDTFKTGWFQTASACRACATVFEEEDGFYAGAIYPMYGMIAGLGALGMLLGWLLGLSFEKSLFMDGFIIILASPWLFLYSRILFLYTHHRFFKNFDGPAESASEVKVKREG